MTLLNTNRHPAEEYEDLDLPAAEVVAFNLSVRLTTIVLFLELVLLGFLPQAFWH